MSHNPMTASGSRGDFFADLLAEKRRGLPRLDTRHPICQRCGEPILADEHIDRPYPYLHKGCAEKRSR